MCNKGLIWLLAVAGFASVLPSTAQDIGGLTAENLRDACDNLVLAVRGVQPISQEDPGAMLCLGYLAGWSQAMEMVPDKPYCLPPVATMQPGDLADLLVTYVDGHPDQNSAPAHDTLLKTITDAFPCSAEETPEPEDESVRLLLTLPVLFACTPATETVDTQSVNQSQDDTSRPSGPYLGQALPGREPRIFAPGIVSTGLSERDVAIRPDGRELYFTGMVGASSTFSAILVTREVEGVWTEPAVAPFSGRYMDLEPAISPDGQRFFFLSDRPLSDTADTPGNHDIWWMPREGESWGAARNLGPPVNTENPEYFPSITRNGDLYFTRRSEDSAEAIYRSRWVDGTYQEPERLGDSVNAAPTQFNAFVDPDERFLIVCYWSHDAGLGGADYYIVFRSPDDTWSEPINLGESINTAEGREWSPYVSPDGKYFFFMSSRATFDDQVPPHPLSYADLQLLHREPLNGNSDIWWVDASFLADLQP